MSSSIDEELPIIQNITSDHNKNYLAHRWVTIQDASNKFFVHIRKIHVSFAHL